MKFQGPAVCSTSIITRPLSLRWYWWQVTLA